jgi:hypothetical protein
MKNAYVDGGRHCPSTRFVHFSDVLMKRRYTHTHTNHTPTQTTHTHTHTQTIHTHIQTTHTQTIHTHTHTHTHTHRIFINFFSTASSVTRTRLNIMLYVCMYVEYRLCIAVNSKLFLCSILDITNLLRLRYHK